MTAAEVARLRRVVRFARFAGFAAAVASLVAALVSAANGDWIVGLVFAAASVLIVLNFGIYVPWVFEWIIRNAVALSDIATVIGAVGGGAVTTLFDDQELFDWYAVGLAIGLFLYFLIGLVLGEGNSAAKWVVTD